MARSCQLGGCHRRRGDPCCADCSRQDCPDRCLNDPARCGQVQPRGRFRVCQKRTALYPVRPKITVFPGEGKDKFIL